MAETVRVKNPEAATKNDEVDRFLEVGKKALQAGINQAQWVTMLGTFLRPCRLS